MASEYSLSEPETVDLPVTENRFVYIEGTGAFSTMAPAMWDEFNAQIRPKIPGADSGENWSAARGDSPGNGHYRCGVLLSAPLAPGTALPGNAKLGSIPDGKYAKFVLKGSLDHMTEAYMKAYEAIKKHDLLKIRQGTECVETYLTDFKTTPPAQQQTAIFLPVDVPSGKYTMTGPERRHLAPTPHRYLHLSGHGASIEEINPGNLWMKFHSEVLPHVPEAHKEGVTMWATANTNVKGKGSAVYRCGALLPKPAEKSHVVPKGSHAHLSNLPDGDYVVFEMTGWFDCLAEAYPEALRRAKEAGFVVMEHEDFLETYLTNPMSTAYNDNKTDIYLPVELQSPTRKHRVETSG